MFEAPSDLDRLKSATRRFAAGVRPHHIAVVAVVTAVGLGMVAARTMALPGSQQIPEGDRMQIQVVAPVEPEVVPGSVMDVGTLVDGFVYRRPAPVVIDAADYASYRDEFEAPEPRPAPRRGDDYAMVAAPPRPEAPPEERRDRRSERWFGFDAPQQDYRAEREARRVRIDRMEVERERREVRWYRSDGQPVIDDGREESGRRDVYPDDLRG